MKQRGMSERHALRVVGMSASALRYVPRPDDNIELRQQIVDMAQRYRRYGAPMIYLKLRRPGSGSITSAWSACTRRRSCRYADAGARRSRRRIDSR